MDESNAAKRNAPHIRRVAEFADQVFALKSLVTEGADWSDIRSAAASIAREIRSLYNNREMALVCTKLDEAAFWCDEKDIEQVRVKLTEARGWVTNYMDVLATD